MSAYVIKPSGEITDVMPKNGSDFSLEEMYALVECDCIEIVHLHDGKIMIVDEDGRNNRKPPNEIAGNYYKIGRSSVAESKARLEKEWGAKGFAVFVLTSDDDPAIVGNALVCEKNMVK